MKETMTKRPAAFIIPFYGDQSRSSVYLNEAIDGLFAQTDRNWQALIVDDASPDRSAKEFLRKIEKKYAKNCKVFWQRMNTGPGVCRNIAVKWAFEADFPIVLFNDSDDISHPERLKTVRETFLEYPAVDLIYSTFKVIDEYGRLVPRDHLSPSIIEIIESLETNPVEGYNAWIDIGTVTGFACLPSSTAVRSDLAYRCPFPPERVSEDSYAWMYMAANGNEFKFMPLIPSFYRIPGDKEGSTQRSRLGRSKFYQEKARVDTEGFFNALHIAIDKGSILSGQAHCLKEKFFRRLAETLRKEREDELAEILLKEFLFHVED